MESAPTIIAIICWCLQLMQLPTSAHVNGIVNATLHLVVEIYCRAQVFHR
ncbi:hypothetical protein RHECNPAF_350008 [Rhizobium etli CNPAF512]|nr:hypothetical protein RHECNPAF_350008 [Rhizobium etli CNPAF512]